VKRRTVSRPAPESGERDPEVTLLIDGSGHPLTREIHALREIILGANPEIRDGVKWNAPSFRTTDYFATLNNPRNPRSRDRVQLILHTGARRKDVTARGKIDDPAGLLEWLAPDRCIATFTCAADIDAKREALQSIVRAWIRLL